MSHMKALQDSLDSRAEIHKREIIRHCSDAIGDLTQAIFYANMLTNFTDTIQSDTTKALESVNKAVKQAGILSALVRGGESCD